MKPGMSREVLVGRVQTNRFPANAGSNAKYTAISFLPRTLYNEFSFFLNLYFLLVALSQLLPFLRIGYMSTYIVPLALVLTISIGKEAIDDIARRRRDTEANAEPYTVLSFNALGGATKGRKAPGARGPRMYDDDNERNGSGIYEITKRSRDLKVGDVLKLKKDQRLPADVVLLKSFANDSSVTAPEIVQGTPSHEESVNPSIQQLKARVKLQKCRISTIPSRVPRRAQTPVKLSFGQTSWTERLTGNSVFHHP